MQHCCKMQRFIEIKTVKSDLQKFLSLSRKTLVKKNYHAKLATHQCCHIYNYAIGMEQSEDWFF